MKKNEKVDGQKQPHFPCPNCGSQVELDIMEILQNPTFTCDACGVHFHMEDDAPNAAVKKIFAIVNGMQDGE
ncbi:MAG: hypothetical protein H6696_08160 [Deferribacteres bacterium]|nr:hypothetical protein [candidate division KSB1 bacterium]MCB9501896.1 hypothetical protein [Deferribacteres bacterium]